MQLRYLKDVTLKKEERIKQPNGTYVTQEEIVSVYKAQMQELTDEVSASVYQADLNKINRLKSVKSELEEYLKGKLINAPDNITKYSIYIDRIKYKIISVKQKYVDISL